MSHTQQAVEEHGSRQIPERPCFCYLLYGVSLRSQWPLPFTPCAEARPPIIELVEGPRALFEEAAREAAGQPVEEDWFQYTRLGDGSSYLRWPGLYDFLIAPDGRRIFGRPAQQDISHESFHTYLLSVALSFSLIKLGLDPLHGTVVAVNGRAFGLLGKSGYGKSTLAGAFLQAGYPILTDDLLVLKEEQGSFLAYPGPPRIKLLPEVACLVFGEQAMAVAMNRLTRKLILPLNRRQSLQTRVPLSALYALNRPPGGLGEDRIIIRRLSLRRAFVALVENSFNDWVSESVRLHPHFFLHAQIASKVPVKLISYPRRLPSLASVRDAILADLAS